MKGILRIILFNIVGIYLAGQIIAGLSYAHDIKILVLAGIALTLAGYIVKPIIKLVTLPINFITLGLFSWLVDVFILYLVTIFVPNFTISTFVFNGFHYNGFSIPYMDFSQLWAFIVCSLVISLFVSFFKYICD